MKENVTKVAELLLQIKSIKLEPANPFKWASGWNSPIYCDNRKTLSFPKVRNFIKSEFVNIIRNKYPEAELIAGVATGAIAIGALVADAMGLPFVYVRPKPKDHGMGNQVEGSLLPGQKVVIVEDLISTGNSSLNALAALRAAQTEVLGMVAIFSYKFKLAEENFRINNCELTTLSNYPALLDLAVKSGQISAEQLETLNEWRKDPGNWTP
jgi:orotate phosphoribosyltransferase